MCVANVVVGKASTSETRGCTPCHFALFDLLPSFEVDQKQLTERYRKQAAQVHPDRFSQASIQEQRHALAETTRLNDAYQTLRVTSLRAKYLLQLRGLVMPSDITLKDPDFLLAQMALHERLDDLHQTPDSEQILVFKKELASAQKALEESFARLWNNPAEGLAAQTLVYKMQFFDKLVEAVEALEERLDA